ncbi:MAG: hypothetical protein AAF791_10115 [Bacteroidota bacterium]
MTRPARVMLRRGLRLISERFTLGRIASLVLHTDVLAFALLFVFGLFPLAVCVAILCRAVNPPDGGDDGPPPPDLPPVTVRPTGPRGAAIDRDAVSSSRLGSTSRWRPARRSS